MRERALYFAALVSFVALVTVVECCALGTHCETLGMEAP